MGIKFQKIAGAVLFALILAVGAGLIADGLVPTAVRPVAEAPAPGVPADDPVAAAPDTPDTQALPLLLAASDPQAGATASSKCKACHTFDEGGAHRVGPNLFAIYGADIGAKPGYAYSNAMAGKPGEWDAATLDAFLTRPANVVPGTKMVFAGIANAQERANLIAYMHSLTPGAAPLPTEAEVPLAAEPTPEPTPEPAPEAVTDEPVAPAPEAAEAPPAEPEAPVAEEPAVAEAPAAPEPAPAPAPAPAADVSPAVAMIAQADVAAGQAAARKCAACHTFDEGGANRVGPNLHGIVGADIAAKPGFRYSNAMTQLEGTWTYEALDAFLARPAAFAKGNRMVFVGIANDQERAALIAYLRSISPNAPPPPQG